MPPWSRRDVLRLSAAAATGVVPAPRVQTAAADRPDAEPDPRIQRSSVDLPSGVRLNVAEMGDADKPALVCLHGFTDSWRSYEPIMPLLAATHRVIAMDMRGHGASTTPAAEFTFDAFSYDVVGCLMNLGIARASIIGHSMGSFVARRIAADHPDRVEKLILVGAALSVDNEVVRGVQREVIALGDAIPREFIEGFQASTVLDHRLLPEWFFDVCVNASARVQPRVWRDTIAGMLGDQQTLRDVNFACPTLIIGGERDGVFNADEQRSLAKAISGSRLTLYRHCGHAPNWEQPLRFVEDVQAFLSE